MSMDSFDFVVIGAGSGGVRAARLASKLGKRVAVVEKSHLGGTCVNLGCIPKKLFVYSSRFRDFASDARAYGHTMAHQGFNWQVLKENKNQEITRLNGIYKKILENAGVEIVSGQARLISQNTIQIGEKTIRGEHILIATGGSAYIPEGPGREHILTSDQVFHLDQVPDSVVIAGGGYIGLEFASIFNGLGLKVHLVHYRKEILRGFEKGVDSHLRQEMEKNGVHFHLEEKIAEVGQDTDGYSVKLQSGGKLSAGLVMAAVGRVPNTQGLGLEACGVELSENGAIAVDQHFQTSLPGVYAIGDVIDRVALTPVAITEAHHVIDHIFCGSEKIMNYANIPTAVFSHPEVGTIGLTSAEARQAGYELEIYQSSFRPLFHTLTQNPEKTLMRLLVDKKSKRVLGLHMVGENAAEIIQGFAVAMNAGATKEDFDRTIGVHPSAAEEFVTMREPMVE